MFYKTAIDLINSKQRFLQAAHPTMTLTPLNRVKRTKLDNEGYMVSFEIIEGNVLRSDHFPKKGEENLIQNREAAKVLAQVFASSTVGTAVNICVVRADHAIVSRVIRNR